MKIKRIIAVTSYNILVRHWDRLTDFHIPLLESSINLLIKHKSVKADNRTLCYSIKTIILAVSMEATMEKVK